MDYFKRYFLIFLALLVLTPNIFSINKDSNLQAYWKLDDLSDSSGNGHTLTNNGATTSNGCYDGSCFNFDGISDYIDTNFQGFNYSSGTITFWANTTDNTRYQGIIGDESGSGEFLGVRFFNSGTRLLFQIDDGTQHNAEAVIPPFPNNEWQYIAVTWGSDGMKLYINGQLNATNAFVGNWVSNSNFSLGKGGGGGTSNFEGSIDEVSIWDRQLNASEVVDIQNNGISLEAIFEITQEYFTSPGNPLDNHTFTFDVETTDLNLITSENATCTYTYNGSTFNLSTSDNLDHSETSFNMGEAQNFTKQFDITYDCTSLLNVTKTDQLNITFFQAQSPLELQIFVPQDQQTFEAGTNLITFHIETNYQAICNYSVINLNSTPIINESSIFDNTNSSIHTSDYTALFPSVRSYPLTFNCVGTILTNESVNLSVLFFLDEELLSQFNKPAFGEIAELSEESFEVLEAILGPMVDLTTGQILFMTVAGTMMVFIVTTISFLLVHIKNTLKTKKR